MRGKTNLTLENNNSMQANECFVVVVFVCIEEDSDNEIIDSLCTICDAIEEQGVDEADVVAFIEAGRFNRQHDATRYVARLPDFRLTLFPLFCSRHCTSTP